MTRWEAYAVTSVYNDRNKYNYWLNVNHPAVQYAYKRYCARTGNPERYPLSDRERREFEVAFIRRHGMDNLTPEWIRFQFEEEMAAIKAPDTVR